MGGQRAGKVARITGVGSGIGRASTLALARVGATGFGPAISALTELHDARNCSLSGSSRFLLRSAQETTAYDRVAIFEDLDDSGIGPFRLAIKRWYNSRVFWSGAMYISRCSVASNCSY